MESEGTDAAQAEIETEHNLKSIGSAEVGTGSVPVVDMSLDDVTISSSMLTAAAEVGFFTLLNHGVSEEAIEEAFGASARFFAQPKEAKEAQAPWRRDMNSGYEYFAQVRPSTGLADQKESIQITAREGAMDIGWPSSEGFEPAARTLLSQAHTLAARVLSLLEPAACPHLEPGTLVKSHNLWSPGGQCTLRMLHYPPIDARAPESMATGYWRAGPHTDWCCVTLLFQRKGEAGLECAPNPKAGGTGGWLKVDPVPGGICVNIGDMLMRWSNKSLLSNLHRVRMPTQVGATPPRPRYSIAFFAQADKAAVIKCDGHEDTTAGEYILGRVRSNFVN
ncbi:hypothetical protein T492DRAFT_998274 [Pavlovales sp. CCMP2436]|nr:hypothetical protein T492DRAFT_998274 [Pavlovales sp. CCMP2436]